MSQYWPPQFIYVEPTFWNRIYFAIRGFWWQNGDAILAFFVATALVVTACFALVTIIAATVDWMLDKHVERLHRATSPTAPTYRRCKYRREWSLRDWKAGYQPDGTEPP